MSAQLHRLPQPAIRPDKPLPRKQSERGASVVEFAIIISLLFLLVFGIIQFGIAFNRDQGLNAAAREGARVASVGGTESEIRTRVHQSQSLFDDADIDLKIDYSLDNGTNYTAVCNDDTNSPHACTETSSPCGTGGIGSLLRVTATVPGSTGGGKYAIVIPFWGNAPINFSAEGAFRCENKS